MSLVEGANPTSKFTWTDDAVTTLHRLVDDKYSAQQIATVLGTTRNAVLGKCFRLNISTNPVPEKRPDRVARRVEKREARVTFRRDFPTEVFIPTEVETPPLHKSIIELDYGDCRYPYGDNPYTFCGHIATFGSSYCAAHNRVVYRPFEVRSRKKVAA